MNDASYENEIGEEHKVSHVSSSNASIYQEAVMIEIGDTLITMSAMRSHRWPVNKACLAEP